MNTFVVTVVGRPLNDQLLGKKQWEITWNAVLQPGHSECDPNGHFLGKKHVHHFYCECLVKVMDSVYTSESWNMQGCL